MHDLLQGMGSCCCIYNVVPHMFSKCPTWMEGQYDVKNTYYICGFFINSINGTYVMCIVLYIYSSWFELFTNHVAHVKLAMATSCVDHHHGDRTSIARVVCPCRL